MGKSSLLATLVTKSFQTNIPKVVSRLVVGPGSIKRIPFTTHIVDTSSDPADKEKLRSEMRSADVICVVYSVEWSREEKAERVSEWLNSIQKQNPDIPVVLVGNKVDLVSDDALVDRKFRVEMREVMEKHKNVEIAVECSAKQELNVEEVFYLAHKAVLHPLSVLFDSNTYDLTPKALRALTRIFKLSDSDRDGVLSDEDVQMLQEKCFGRRLSQSKLDDMKAVIAEALPHGLSSTGGINLQGFLFTQVHFIQRGKQELPWTMMRAFGYNDTLVLSEKYLSPVEFGTGSWIGVKGEKSAAPSASGNNKEGFELAPGVSGVGSGFVAQLSESGERVLRHLFSLYDKDNDGVLSAAELVAMFETAPNCPFNNAGVPELCDAIPTSRTGAMALDDFVGAFHLFLLLNPGHAVKYLIYLGVSPDAVLSSSPGSILEAVRGEDVASRRVLLIPVLGSDGSGKSSALATLIRSGDRAGPGGAEVSAGGPRVGSRRYGLGMVSLPRGRTVYVAFANVDEASVEEQLAPGSPLLARSSVAAVFFDPSAPASFERAKDVSAAAAASGVGSVFVASRGDTLRLDPSHPVHAFVASSDLGDPLQVSCKTGAHFEELLHTLVKVADAPDLGLPPAFRSTARKSVGPGTGSGSGVGPGLSWGIAAASAGVVVLAGAAAAAMFWKRRK